MKKIKEFYSKALDQINQNNYEACCKIIHNEMPVDLYDLSLDMMDNRNLDFKHKPLKGLIKEVHDKLALYSDPDIELFDEFEEIESNPDLHDDFQGDIF